MKYFASCEIIKDLLPNYTDNKLSSDSNLLVKEHIDGCYSCKNEYLHHFRSYQTNIQNFVGHDCTFLF